MMKHEKQISQNHSKAKRIIFRIALVTVLVCATVFIINLPQKIQDDYIKSLPENFQYEVSVGNEIEAKSMDEINKYLMSFERTNSQSNTVVISDEMKKEILKISQTALRGLQLELNGAISTYLDIIRDTSKKLSSYTESYIDSGEIEITADIITTDCYDQDNNITTVFFYQVTITVEYPQWEQYCFCFSPDLENIFSFYYMNNNTMENILSNYTDESGWYEYSTDGNYLKINELFLSYLNKNSNEYDSEYITDTPREYY